MVGSITVNYTASMYIGPLPHESKHSFRIWLIPPTAVVGLDNRNLFRPWNISHNVVLIVVGHNLIIYSKKKASEKLNLSPELEMSYDRGRSCKMGRLGFKTDCFVINILIAVLFRN